MTGPTNPGRPRADYGTRQGGRHQTLMADLVGRRAAQIYLAVETVSIREAVRQAMAEHGVEDRET